MKRSIIQNKYIFSLTTIILLLFGWILLSSLSKNSYAFPSLSLIAKSFIRLLNEYGIIVIRTIGKIIISVGIGVIISILIFALYVYKKDLLGFLTPILNFLHVVPIIGISLYLFLIFDDLRIPPYVVTISVIVPLIVEALITAYDNIDKAIEDALKLEQVPFFIKFFKVYLPMILPYFLMALIQSFSLGIKAMVMGEYLCYTNNSLGALLYNSKLEDNGLLIAILILLFLLSVLCEVIIRIFQKKISK